MAVLREGLKNKRKKYGFFHFYLQKDLKLPGYWLGSMGHRSLLSLALTQLHFNHPPTKRFKMRWALALPGALINLILARVVGVAVGRR